MTHFYGCLPDAPDPRDFIIDRSVIKPGSYPDHFDLRPKMKPVYDQGNLGRCVWMALRGALEWQFTKFNEPQYDVCDLFGYYNTRLFEGNANQDTGCSARGAFKSANSIGYCDVGHWTEDIRLFNRRPSTAAYQNAKGPHHRLINYVRLGNNLDDFRYQISNGNPVNISILVYQELEDVRADGYMKMPTSTTVLGGHELLGVGYYDSQGILVCRNSWGRLYGHDGHVYLPYAFIQNPRLTFDNWCATRA
jgi:hypothetical protein